MFGAPQLSAPWAAAAPALFVAASVRAHLAWNPRHPDDETTWNECLGESWRILSLRHSFSTLPALFEASTYPVYMSMQMNVKSRIYQKFMPTMMLSMGLLIHDDVLLFFAFRFVLYHRQVRIGLGLGSSRNRIRDEFSHARLDVASERIKTQWITWRHAECM